MTAPDPLADPTAASLRVAARAQCCGDAACHYEDCGLACEARDVRRAANTIRAYLRHRADNELCDFAAEMLREEADAVEVEADG